MVNMINKIILKVQDGNFLESDPEFLKFKTKNFQTWGDIKVILIQIEKLLDKHNILTTKLDGNKVVKISRLMRPVTEKELFDCLDNKEMVMELIPNRIELVTEKMETQLV